MKKASSLPLLASRPCERICVKCEKPLHYSRFYRRLRRMPNGTVWHFDAECKSCQQINRTDQKNVDRALTIVERRAKDRARRLHVTKEWMWVRMGWQTLVPMMRALMTDEARCPGCGHRFDNERDIQIEHRDPPRFHQDWARESARNIGFLCTPCNSTKRKADYPQWLDNMEEARISNETHRAAIDAAAMDLINDGEQLSLFGR